MRSAGRRFTSRAARRRPVRFVVTRVRQAAAGEAENVLSSDQRRGSVTFAKAFAGAFMAGLPFSIAGTIYGAAVLALSGLPHHPVEMVKRLVAGQQK